MVKKRFIKFLALGFLFYIHFSASAQITIPSQKTTQPKAVSKKVVSKKIASKKTNGLKADSLKADSLKADSLKTKIQKKDPYKVVFTKFVLDNGLTVILHQDNATPIVAVTAMYHVGSKNEDTSQKGFAHFFERLLYEGSKYIKKGEYFDFVSAHGGDVEANTNFDRTFFYEVLPSNQIKLGLWLESERMLQAKITQEGIDSQRAIVKELKRNMYENTPYGTYLPEIFKLAYKVSSYGWVPISDIDHLEQATLKDFINFYRTYYVPNNCVLTIAGDIDTNFVKNQVIEYFADIPRGNRNFNLPTINEPLQNNDIKNTIIQDNIDLPAVFMAYRVPSIKSKDYFALNLLNNLLSVGKSSRLYNYLVDKRQTAFNVDGIPIINEDGGLLVFYGIANIEQSPEIIQNDMEDVFNEISSRLVSEKDFEKAKNEYETNFITSRNSMLKIAEGLSKNELFLGNADNFNKDIKSIQSVTRQDVLDCAKRYLVAKNRVVLFYVPKSNKN
ncbi:MAG: pitrilysin family protein [Alphaproteobacteria bacterium]|nr:pitrilysin family protein [Alphaproteobacteria bacterium]